MNRNRITAMVADGVVAVVITFTIATAAAAGPAEAPSPEASTTEAEKQALLAADREFDRVTAERGAAGWASFFDPFGTMLPPTGAPVWGPVPIRDSMVALDRGDYELRWHPERAEVLVPGRLGLTVGRYERRSAAPAGGEGEKKVVHGDYITVWRRQPDGTWKVVFDTGTIDGPPEAAGPAD